MTDRTILHKQISYVKSFVRLIGYGVLTINIVGGACLLFLAEVLGIAEEVFGA